MATYGYNSMLCKFSNPNYECHNYLATRSNSTGLKKTFKTAQKTKVEPDMTTYWFNSVIYMYFITNLTWLYLNTVIKHWLVVQNTVKVVAP